MPEVEKIKLQVFTQMDLVAQEVEISLTDLRRFRVDQAMALIRDYNLQEVQFADEIDWPNDNEFPENNPWAWTSTCHVTCMGVHWSASSKHSDVIDAETEVWSP